MRLNQVDSATLRKHFNVSTEALESLSLWNGKTQLTPGKIDANPPPARVIEVHELSSADFAKHVPTRLVSKKWAFVFSPSCVFPFHRGLPCRRVTGASIIHVPCRRVFHLLTGTHDCTRGLLNDLHGESGGEMEGVRKEGCRLAASCF